MAEGIARNPERAARRGGRWRGAWWAAWPRLLAIAIALTLWQGLVWVHWRPVYVMPGPAPVFQRLLDELRGGTLLAATRVTLTRALIGYAVALLAGSVIGLAMAQFSVLRAGLGSLIAGLQSMPSVAWFPLAILLFRLSESAILFVVVLGAAPAIANGLLAAIDHVPPLLLRAGRVLGARQMALYRYVVLPAALPDFLAGNAAGVGVRLAEPARSRAAGSDRKAAVDRRSTAVRTGVFGCRGANRLDDRHPGHRRWRRRAAVRPGQEAAARAPRAYRDHGLILRGRSALAALFADRGKRGAGNQGSRRPDGLRGS